MEERIIIEHFSWYPTATQAKMKELMDGLVTSGSKELILIPDPLRAEYYRGILLARYYTPALSQITGVREISQEGAFQYIMVSRIVVRGFLMALTRKMQALNYRAEILLTEDSDPSPEALLRQDSDGAAQAIPLNIPNISAYNFLKQKTPAQIEAELNARIIGQSELTKSVADFLYYHALRQLHPDLPQRPLLISGPSGSGKTEVWRVAGQLYGNFFTIKIVDGSNLSCEGWSGNFKIDTYIDSGMVNGGILVVDEFDKLTKPRHSSSGDNISLDIQAEFLKLVEGEYHVTEKRKQTNMTSKKMGFVLVGAFESLRKAKNERHASAAPQIGFCAAPTAAAPRSMPVFEKFTDEDLISYGIMPELVGRIAAKCTTSPLTDQAYMDIICGPHSRVTRIKQVLQSYGADFSELISAEEIRKLISASKSNKTGVRWVCSQVETRLLEAIREQGLFSFRANAS